MSAQAEITRYFESQVYTLKAKEVGLKVLASSPACDNLHCRDYVEKEIARMGYQIHAYLEDNLCDRVTKIQETLDEMERNLIL